MRFTRKCQANVSKALLLVSLAIPAFASTTLIDKRYDDFSGGIDATHLPDKIGDTYLQENFNFRTDEVYGLSRREGNKLLTSTTTVATKELWKYIDSNSNEWLIKLSTDGTLIAGQSLTSTSTGTFSIILTTNVTMDVRTDADQGLGKIWFTNRTDGLASWGGIGTTFYMYPDAPKASLLRLFRNRVVLGDLANAQSSIHLSGVLDGSDWTTDSSYSTSSVVYRIGGVDDGSKVYFLHVGLDELLVGKQNATFALYGYNQSDFGIRIVSPDVGSVYPRTVRQHDNRTLMLSNRGIDAYTPPYTFQRISEPVQAEVDPLTSAGVATKYDAIDSQAQWQLGVSSPTDHISTTISPGNIKVVNNTFNDTSGADFSSGTISYGKNGYVTIVDTNTNQISYLSVSSLNVLNPSFDIAGASPKHAANWTIQQINNTSGTLFCTSSSTYLSTRTANPGVAVNGSHVLMSSITIDRSTTGGSPSNWDWSYSYANLKILDAGDSSLIVSTSIFIGDGDMWNGIAAPAGASQWKTTTLHTDPYVGRKVQLVIQDVMKTVSAVGPSGRSLESIFTSDPFYAGSSVTVYHYGWGYNTSDPACEWAWPTTSVRLYDYVYTEVYPAISTFTSRTFDTQVASPTGFDFNGTFFDTETVKVGFTLRTSSDGSNWGSRTAVTTGTYDLTPSSRERYVQYLATFTAVITTSPQVAYITDVTLGSFSTGYFQVGSVRVGDNISSWGNFSSNRTLNSGNVTYQLNSDNNCNFAEGGWTEQALDTVIGVPVRACIGARILFDTNASTSAPFVDNITFNWVEGQSPPDPTAQSFRSRYTLFFSTNVGSQAYNNRSIVFNRNDKFDKLDGINANAAVIYTNKVIYGDNTNTGFIYQLDGSTTGSDLGGSVTSYFKLPRYGGDYPGSYKIFDRADMTVTRDDASESNRFRMEYSMDGSTTVYYSNEVEIATGTYISRLKFYFPMNQPRQSRYIDIAIRELLGGTVFYISRMRLYGTVLEPD